MTGNIIKGYIIHNISTDEYWQGGFDSGWTCCVQHAWLFQDLFEVDNAMASYVDFSIDQVVRIETIYKYRG